MVQMRFCFRHHSQTDDVFDGGPLISDDDTAETDSTSSCARTENKSHEMDPKIDQRPAAGQLALEHPRCPAASYREGGPAMKRSWRNPDGYSCARRCPAYHSGEKSGVRQTYRAFCLRAGYKTIGRPIARIPQGFSMANGMPARNQIYRSVGCRNMAAKHEPQGRGLRIRRFVKIPIDPSQRPLCPQAFAGF